ncbi:MAG: mechanosensitive ion channel protein MscS [Betaproteobacteria bacterium RIFCSPLOWO2_12_FULL_68_19]|nr:MAG: mechanosensitive ion channel protein MscS [Betaproteobacteria bacterium RIFCSPLOWO2_12_FULL_68_19]
MQRLVSYFRELDEGTRLVATQVGRIAVILVLAWALQIVAARLIRLFRIYMSRRTGGDEVARIETLARVFRNLAGVVIVLVAGMLILGEVGISVAPILATAGVAGIAIGFGAQTLVKDYFSGFFLLLDDQVRQGDVVEIAGKGGLVEEVTLRYVRLRDLEGHVHFVPNSEISVVTNRTREYATAVIEVGIAYREDPEQAFAVMRKVADGMRADPDWRDRVVADLEVLGVETWADSAVVLRARVRVVPAIQQWNVKREFLKRLKKAYDDAGIEIPYPHLTIYAGQNKDGSAPPFHLLKKNLSNTE